MELSVPSHRSSNKCNVHVELLDLTLQKYCSAWMKSVNGKWRPPSSEASGGDNASSPTDMAWPSAETRGHTGYLTFASSSRNP
ncbi:hypothetical protein J1N35_024319 [Gossypium stocksii]|uniref:Uncharacterized protein n=1 Tax=Gossypium stocksii TaxID=47602 RepID=A0A9D3VK83_9ROSI|nr:hypothetical protein J1N35_024319 [Gossypium stocksii]